MMPPGGAKSYIIKELNFDERQIREYDELVREHRRMMRTTNDKIRALKRKLYSKLSEPQPNQSEVDRLSQMIAENVAYIEEQTFEHFQKVRALCNDRQKQKFDTIIDKVMNMMSGGGRPPHPPPPPPPPPPPHERR